MSDPQELIDLRLSLDLLLRKLIAQKKLRSKDEDMLRRRMQDETLADIGKAHGVGQERVRQRLAKAIRVIEREAAKGTTDAMSEWELARRGVEIAERDRAIEKGSSDEIHARVQYYREQDAAARAKEAQDRRDAAWLDALAPCAVSSTPIALDVFVDDIFGGVQPFTYWDKRIPYVELMHAIGDHSFYPMGLIGTWTAPTGESYSQCQWYCSANRQGKCGRTTLGAVPQMCSSGRVQAK